MNKKFIFFTFLVTALILSIETTVYTATIKVTTTQDNVPGSLRAAITIANTNGEDDTINLPAGTYILSGEAGEDDNISGDLDINTIHTITIIGDVAETTFIDGNQVDRVIHIHNGVISIFGITFQNGKSQTLIVDSGENGGGIYNNGSLTLTDCVITNNRSGSGGIYNLIARPGGYGGGIYNCGSLTITNCTISDNHTGSGVPATDIGSIGGNGGGISNSGTLSLTNCTIKNNTIGNGGGGLSGISGGGGGGIHNCGDSTLTDCTIKNNKAGKGGGGFSSGYGGNGGGILNTGEASATLKNCTISNNTSGDSSFTIVALYCGNGGNGGGICNTCNAEIILKNCTVSNNNTGKGDDNIYCDGGKGGNGGGIYNSSTINLTSCTISNNNTGDIEKLNGNDVFNNNDGNGGNGGGFYNYSGTATIQNTIIADNQVAPGGEAPDYWGTFNSRGYNLIENTEKCNINGNISGNITGVDPILGPLSHNGGPTQTHALLPGSPAIDAGYNFIIYFDQRGYTRPVDIPEIPNAKNGTDIGAYEYESYSSPRISLNRTQLNFGGDTTGTNTGSQTFLISNSGDGTLHWYVSDDAEWLNCTPFSGTHSAVITVSVDPSTLSAGIYTDTITVTSYNALNSPQTIGVTLEVYNANATGKPFGYFETPIDGSTVSSSIPVTGWVLDDIEVINVKIYREQGANLVYIGDAIFVEGARPDVEQAYPDYPFCYRAGWGYFMLTNFLPNGGNGSFTLHAIAADREGNQVTLGTKTIVCDNTNAVKPFGAIDIPTQGGTASGSNFRNQGWVLTPPPNKIPEDGSTIYVYVDGVKLGNPVYNIYRSDIESLFPGYANNDGAHAYFDFDTTSYENGIYTIMWTAMDNAGNSDGIGSTYFSIWNSTGTRDQRSTNGKTPGLNHDFYTKKVLDEIPIDSSYPIRIKKGYNHDVEPQTVYPDSNGIITIKIKELERLEIHLFEPTLNVEPRTLNISWLPIGSTLDRKRGIFYWQPGPGFIGDYEFVFIEKPGSGELNRKVISIRVKISPKFQKE